MTSLENMLLFYNHTSSTDTNHQILKKCFQILPEIPKMTIQAVSEYCCISTATFNRFFKALGYRNYTAFQEDVRNCVERYYFHNRIAPAVTPPVIDPNCGIKDYMDILSHLLDQANKLTDDPVINDITAELARSKQIVIFSYGILHCELNLQSDLIMSGKSCEIYLNDADKLEQAKLVSPDTYAFVLFPKCLDGYAPTIELLDILNKNHCKICCITSVTKKSFLSKAYQTIVFEGHELVVDSFFIEMVLCMLSIKYRQDYMDLAQD